MDDFFTRDSQTAGTKGLVYIGDKIIVYRRDRKASIDHPGELDVPGGGPEGDETPFETFAREAYEEFHVRIDQSDIVYARRHASRLQPGKFAWHAVAKLPAKAEKDIIFGDEGEDFQLMPLDEFMASPDASQFLKDRTAEYLRAIQV